MRRAFWCGRPANRARFSGHAIVELLNPARRFDWAMMSGTRATRSSSAAMRGWGLRCRILRCAAEIQSGALCGGGFRQSRSAETCAAGRGGAASTSDQEEGLRWDMLTQVGAALKGGANLNREIRLYDFARRGMF